jgi:hypothetical protein
MGEDFEMIVIEVKCRDPKFTWEVVGTYRDPKEDMRVIEILAAQTECLGNSTKRSIIGEYLNLPSAGLNGNVECTSRSQAFVNRFEWKNEYTQVLDSPI